MNKSPPLFFLLVFVLSAPFWLIGQATGLQLMPGLPVSALAAFVPAIAAMILVSGEGGGAEVEDLLKRSVDYARIERKIWLVPTIFLMPGVMVLSYWIMRWTGASLPVLQVSIPAAALVFVAAFVAGLGEELGWCGYAIDPMQARWGALGAAVLLGLMWAAWHVVALLQAHRSLEWIAWWGLGTVALRVITVWLYNNTGKSVFSAALFHAMSNLSYFVFPNGASHYDPRTTGLVLAVTAAAVALVWGPRTLTRRGGS
jgi:membrane protease YdiL (CAAX protease family)